MVTNSESTFKRAIAKSSSYEDEKKQKKVVKIGPYEVPVGWLHWFGGVTRWFGYGLILLFLFCLEIYFGIVTLSAHQLHHRVRDIDINGERTVIVSQLKKFGDEQANVKERYKTAMYDVDDISFDLAKHKQELAELKRQENKIGSEKLDLQGQETLLKEFLDTTNDEDTQSAQQRLQDVRSQLAATERDLQKTSREIAFVERNMFELKCDIVQDVISADNIRVIQTSRLLNDYGLGIQNKPTDGLDKALALGEYFNLHQDITREQKGNLADKTCDLPEIQRAKINISISRQLAEAVNDIDYFQDRDSEQRSEYDDGLIVGVAADSKEETSKSFWQIFNFPALITWPQQMLTIIVVLIMGALGATISVTRTYLDKDIKPWLPAYIFMPLLGAVTGFVVFVLAKAGVLIIADGGSNGSEAYLSPYFISFLGLVSGMLVIDALDTITKIGRTWFSSSTDGVKRWAVGLEATANDDKLVAKIAEKLGEKAYKIKAWLTAEESVPPRTQSDLALILDKDIRAIFTDIPPHDQKSDDASD